ncbi:MAG: hypothetical protein K2J66_08045, partial [Muribaculaceae bacterium]|nr:hypothetical protein [Muribaculaceae bacterium]
MYLIILAFTIAVVFAVLLLVFTKTGRKIPANLADSNHTPYPFRLIAIGMVLAFFPTAFGLLAAVFLPQLINIVWYQYLLGLLCQWFGAFLMTLGFLYMYRWHKSNPRVPKSGFLLGIIGSGMGLMANSMMVLMDIVGGAFVPFYMAIFTIASIIMSVACFRLSACYTRFRGLGIAFIVLTLTVLLIDYGPLSYCTNDSYFFWIIIDSYGNHAFALGVALVLLVVTVYGLRLAWARPKAVIASDDANEAAYYYRAETVPASAPAASANEDILQKLKGYDNARLRKIVDNPDFHSQAVVEKAGELLARREAWEKIKDLDDAELLEMTMADKGLYDGNIVEAAAMELYQRDSKLLADTFASLTPDTLAAIAAGTAPAPEG